MNVTTHTRWSCRVIRIWSGVFASDEHRPGLGSRHIAACAECQRYFSVVSALETALRNEAPAHFHAPSAVAEGRIMRAVRYSAPPRRHAARPTMLTLAGAAAALALTIGVVVRNRLPSPVPPTYPATTLSQMSPPTAVANATAATTWTAPVTTLLTNDPLQNEVNSVYADAKSAARFLALNFLPGSSEDRNSSSQRDG